MPGGLTDNKQKHVSRYVENWYFYYFNSIFKNTILLLKEIESFISQEIIKYFSKSNFFVSIT